jgi:hypothetical protein
VKPSIGRIVHFVVKEGVHRPAVIVTSQDINFDRQMIDVQVFVDPTSDNTIPFRRNTPHDEIQKQPGTWHWPEREE